MLMVNRAPTQRLDAIRELERAAKDHELVAEQCRNPEIKARLEQEASQLRQDAQRARGRFVL